MFFGSVHYAPSALHCVIRMKNNVENMEHKEEYVTQ